MKFNLKNILYYGGLEEEVYKKYKGHILEEDVRHTSAYLAISGIGFFVLGTISAFTSGFAHVNVKLYLVSAILLLGLWTFQHLLIQKKGLTAHFHYVFLYSFMAVLYFESIALTMLHPEMPAVTYIGVLLMLPLLLAVQPAHMILFQIFFVGIFCVCTKMYKYPAISQVDVWNAISFLVVSIIAIVIIIPVRINHLVQSLVIKDLSERDILTGLKNRNTYELDIIELSRKSPLPICIYADANGLHELNDTKGHKAGDNLLKAVGQALQETFGDEYTYRTGGDEFVSFAYGLTSVAIEIKLKEIETKLDHQGYHASMGYAVDTGVPLDDLIRNAETMMYVKKAEYYKKSGHDRRLR